MKNITDKLLNIANKEIGTKEQPANSNKVKYNTWYYGRAVSGPDYPWCVVFVQWLFKEAGSPLPYKTASCGSLKTYYSKLGKVVYDSYRPGDLVLFDFSGKKNKTQHIGICESIKGTNITTIDGNTGTDNEANGGAVLRRTRNIKYVTCAIRPYDEDSYRDIVQKRFGFEDSTMDYLEKYKYATSLLKKLAESK